LVNFFLINNQLASQNINQEKRFKMKSKSLFSGFIFVLIFGIGLAVAYTMHGVSNTVGTTIIVVGAFVVALIISSAIKIADPWDKAVVLRLGQFHTLTGPALSRLLLRLKKHLPRILCR
jgi:branched-subunit amino acid ABC-type transport system permease component